MLRNPRLALVVLCSALALVVAACGDDDSGGGGGSSSSGKKNYKMTLIAGVKGDEFYITMNCGAQAKAKELGVTLDFQGPQEFDAAQQTPIVNAVAAKKPDAVLIAPTDTKALYAPIKQMADAGTKIVLVDTTLDQPDMAVSQIASDNEAGGETAAKALADLIGGKGKVFVVNVKPGISTTDAREKGFVERARRRPGSTTSGASTPTTSPRRRPRRPRPRCRRTPTSRASSAPTCSRPRAPRAASARRARRSRSSASTPARSRSRTSRTARSRR